jgi:hypothetical protein
MRCRGIHEQSRYLFRSLIQKLDLWPDFFIQTPAPEAIPEVYCQFSTVNSLRGVLAGFLLQWVTGCFQAEQHFRKVPHVAYLTFHLR